MIQLKALYFRYRNQLWFSACLILFGIGLFIWWQMAQSTSTVTTKDISSVTANQKKTIGSTQLKNKQTETNNQRQIVIDVKGGVHRPGVYYFPQEPIVADVLDKAGGVLSSVNRIRINFAASLKNGQVLYIPVGDEQQPSEYPLPGNKMSHEEDNSVQGDANENSDKINLNTADIAELQNLPGIGQKRAQDIINERNKLGGFKNITDLQEVSGIGEKTFAKLKPLVTI